MLWSYEECKIGHSGKWKIVEMPSPDILAAITHTEPVQYHSMMIGVIIQCNKRFLNCDDSCTSYINMNNSKGQFCALLISSGQAAWGMIGY